MASALGRFGCRAGSADCANFRRSSELVLGNEDGVGCPSKVTWVWNFPMKLWRFSLFRFLLSRQWRLGKTSYTGVRL